MSRPVVASYCTTFLKPEMLHIYRQVTSLTRYRTVVLTKERQHEERFPFSDLRLLPKPRSNFIRRFWLKYIRRAPPIFYRGEFQVLRSTLKEVDARLMHIYFGHTAVHLLPFIKVWERPAIVSFHGADVMLRPHDPEYALRMHEMLQTVPLVLARSRSLAHRLEALGCPDSKLRLNRTGIPLAEFPFVERTTPVENDWHCVQASRLIPKKGLLTAIRAFALFRRHYPKARFSIAGEGPLKPELEKLAADCGVEHAVSLRGFLAQDELRSLFHSAHLFLHPSEVTPDENQEGVPNSMLEAMSTGLPVVATQHGGIPEAVRDGTDGFLVRERSAESVCDAMCRVTETPRIWMEMARSASGRVAQEFEQKKQVARLESYYDEAAEMGRAS